MAAIRVKSGRLVDPYDFTNEDIRDTDFVHSISGLNRFHAHSLYPYSVGQHTLVLYKHVPLHVRRAALVHDFSEAWFNDMATPVKVNNPDYSRAEKYAGSKIAAYYGVSEAELDELHPFDKRIYKDERNALWDPETLADLVPGMGDEREPLGIDPWFFRERYWRDVRDELRCIYIKEFCK
jgi:hypothetical protein